MSDAELGSTFGPEGDEYDIAEELGRGSAARVMACQRRRTGEALAVKIVDLRRLRLQGGFEEHLAKLKREVQILGQLSHERIVRLHGVHWTERWCFLVMERIRGGELFEYIAQRRQGGLSEPEARHIFIQLLEAVGYMHSKNVIHRDLKPENILIAASREAPEPLTGNFLDVKIADFGLSKLIGKDASMARTLVGTPQYWAPEVLRVQMHGGTYSEIADVWSLGVTLFVMLCGRYPFGGNRAKVPLDEQIRTAAFDMSSARWQKVSDDAKELIRGLLQVDTSRRLSLSDCLAHRWVVGSASQTFSQAIVPLVPDVDSAQPRNDGVVATREGASGGGRQKRMKTAQEEHLGLGHAPATCADASVEQHKPARNEAREQDPFCCLSELLGLQVSIVASLEMACIASQRTDQNLAFDIQDTFKQARDLFQHVENVVSRYAETATQVSQVVLPDLELAVQEREPTLATSLLGMVQSWVVNMRTDGETAQRRYAQLEESVLHLIQHAHKVKSSTDQMLAQSLRDVEIESGAILALAPPGHQGFTQTGHCADSAVEAAASTNNWAGMLFERLTLLTPDGRSHGVGETYAGGQGNPANATQEDWKRDLIDLLFMTPGFTPSSLPKVQPVNTTSTIKCESLVSNQTLAELRPSEPRNGADETLEEPPLGGACDKDDVVIGSSALMPYVPTQDAKPSVMTPQEADAAMHSSASLLRALRELKRVDQILQGCSAFWLNMDTTVQKLTQLREHTERLVGFAGSSVALKERFEQRLSEYGSFWAAVERVCRQYCNDHRAAAAKVYDFTCKVDCAANTINTIVSARNEIVRSNLESSSAALALVRAGLQ